jgi:hypothetical protein
LTFEECYDTITRNDLLTRNIHLIQASFSANLESHVWCVHVIRIQLTDCRNQARGKHLSALRYQSKVCYIIVVVEQLSLVAIRNRALRRREIGKLILMLEMSDVHGRWMAHSNNAMIERDRAIYNTINKFRANFAMIAVVRVVRQTQRFELRCYVLLHDYKRLFIIIIVIILLVIITTIIILLLVVIIAAMRRSCWWRRSGRDHSGWRSCW